MQKEMRNEIFKVFKEELRGRYGTFLENPVHRERKLSWNNTLPRPTSTVSRDPLTLYGPLEDLRVPPWVGKGFPPPGSRPTGGERHENSSKLFLLAMLLV